MTTPQWRDDESLLAELRQALTEAGPATDQMTSVGRAAYAWRTIDAELELASLVFDSDADMGRLVRAPADGEAWTLVFEGATLSVQLELSDTALFGQLIPPAPGEVVVQQPDGHATQLYVDEVGIFSMSPPPSSPFRIRASVEGSEVVTEWVNR